MSLGGKGGRGIRRGRHLQEIALKASTSFVSVALAAERDAQFEASPCRVEITLAKTGEIDLEAGYGAAIHRAAPAEGGISANLAGIEIPPGGHVQDCRPVANRAPDYVILLVVLK